MTGTRRDLLDAAAQVTAKAETGAQAVLHSLHRNPSLRDEIRLSTYALAPLLWRDEHGWFLTSLLVDGSPGSDQVSAPNAAITWTWPNGDVESITKLSPDRFTSLTDVELPLRLPASHEALQDLLTAIDDQDLAVAQPSERIVELIRASTPSPILGCYAELLPGHVHTGTALTPDYSSGEHPNFRSLAREAADLAKQAGSEHIAESITTALEERSRPGARIAIVGEFNRGKSTLVNHLIGADVVPTGPNPVTRSVTLVRHGVEPHLSVHWPDGTVDRRTLSDDVWSDLRIDTSTEEDTVPGIMVETPSQVLQSLDVELIDTPGLQESRAGRLMQTRQAIARSDVAVVVISVNNPVSLTETRLIEDEILSRHLPRIVVVVTRLDDLEEDQRSDVVRTIENRLRTVDARIPVLWGPGLEGDASRVQRIWEVLAAEVQPQHRRRIRDERALRQVRDATGSLLALVDERLQEASLSEEEWEDAKRTANDGIRRLELAWDHIVTQMESQQLVLRGGLEQRIRASADRMTQDLTAQVGRVPDLKAWWTSEFEPQFRRQLQALASDADRSLRDALQRDAAWLESTLRTEFDVHAPSAPASSVSPVVEPVDVSDEQLKDVKRIRTMVRIGSAVGTVGGALAGLLFLPALPILMTVGGGVAGSLWAEGRSQETDAEQRQRIRQRVTELATEATGEMLRAAVREVDAAYEAMLRDIGGSRRAWLADRKAATDIPRVAENQFGVIHTRLDRIMAELDEANGNQYQTTDNEDR